MRKPHWKPDVDRVAGWGLHAQSEHFCLLLRPGLLESWEWMIRNRSGVLVQLSHSTELVEAINAAEAAWEQLPNG